MIRATEIIGLRFGRAVPLRRTDKNRQRLWNYECQCDCGTLFVTNGSSLRRGLTRSCGCLMHRPRPDLAARNTTHGLSKTATWQSFHTMIQRCENPNNPKYPRYGGRGILVCDKWHRFEEFFKDMGLKPEGKTIGRIDNDGHYEPANCEWQTDEEQARNRSNNRIVEFNGEKHLLVEWSEKMGIPHGALRQRLHRGWSVERALTEPLRSY